MSDPTPEDFARSLAGAALTAPAEPPRRAIPDPEPVAPIVEAELVAEQASEPVRAPEPESVLEPEAAPPPARLSLADLRSLQIRAEIDEADVSAVATGMPAYATADAYGDRKFPIRITRISHELGRKTVRDDDPRARVDTRILEVTAIFDGKTDVELPLGLRMAVHVGK